MEIIVLGAGPGCGEEIALVWVPAGLWGLGGHSGGAALSWELPLGCLGAEAAAAQTQLCFQLSWPGEGSVQPWVTPLQHELSKQGHGELCKG